VHRNAVFDVEWMPGENKLLTASGDQTIALWDIATEQVVSVFRGHSSSVKTVRFLPMHNGLLAFVTWH
jgi:denticleless